MIAESRKQLAESRQKVNELEEQVRRLVMLLKENNISTAKLMKTCTEVTRHADALAGSQELERLTEIGHQVTTLRNADEEIVKSEQRNRMQTEDLASEFEAQKKHQKEIQQMIDPLYRHVVERKAGQ
jgi:GMP synthase-like glutamine amidotransferase